MLSSATFRALAYREEYTQRGAAKSSSASPANFDYIKRLGASQVFDHSGSSIKEDLVAAFKGKKVVGAFTNGTPRPQGHAAIVDACSAVILSSPAKRKFVALTMKSRFPIPEGIETKFIEPLEGDKKLASTLFNDFLPKALAAGYFVPSPPAQVAGKGLESIQGAMNLVKEGVSAKKIVVII